MNVEGLIADLQGRFPLAANLEASPGSALLHLLADQYERWLPLQELGRQVFEDPRNEGKRDLFRKAHAVGDAAETNMRRLRTKLSALPCRDRVDLARKARIYRFDASDWLTWDKDPLRDSLCDDILRLSGATAIPEPYPIPAEILDRLETAEADVPELPWDVRRPDPVGPVRRWLIARLTAAIRWLSGPEAADAR